MIIENIEFIEWFKDNHEFGKDLVELIKKLKKQEDVIRHRLYAEQEKYYIYCDEHAPIIRIFHNTIVSGYLDTDRVFDECLRYQSTIGNYYGNINMIQIITAKLIDFLEMCKIKFDSEKYNSEQLGEIKND